MSVRNPFPTINAFRDFVSAELTQRAFAFPTPTIAPFARLTSGKSDTEFNYSYFTLGLHGYPDDANYFDLAYGNDDVVGYAYQNGQRIRVLSTMSPLTKHLVSGGSTDSKGFHSPAEGRHPIPGITSINVEWKGIKDPIIASIEWRCYNTTQLEFLRPHFLLPNAYVILEWGQQFSDINNFPTLNFASPSITQTLTQLIISGRDKIIDDYITPSNGNYNILIGLTGDHRISMTPDGGYICVTRILSVSESIFGITNHYTFNAIPPAKTSGINTSIPTGMGVPQQRADDTAASIRAIKNAAEYFADGGEFDLTMSTKLEDNVEKVKVHGQSGTSILGVPQFGPIYWITWKAFIEKILPGFFDYIVQHPGIRKEANILKMFNKPQINSNQDLEPSVGNNKNLKSADPTTMVIVQPNMTKNDESPPLFPADPIFTNVAKTATNSGKLSTGVWINSNAIKESFANYQTFMDSFSYLLSRMSNATGNYWNLEISWDEEKYRFVIHDRNFVGPKDGDEITQVFHDLNFYTFNKATDGETLTMEFEASLGKEMMAQALLATNIQQKNGSPSTQEILSQSPSLSTPSSGYLRILNVDPLNDTLGQAVSRTQNVVSSPVQTLFTDKGSTERASSRAGAGNRSSQQSIVDVPPPVNRSGVDNFQNVTNQQDQIEQRKKEISLKFEDRLINYIEIDASAMVKAIYADGINNPRKVNNFVAPIPTDIELQLTINGIAGISLFDGFLVDKLPPIYKQYGIFLVAGLIDEVTPEAWRTRIRGMYYWIWSDGKGPPSER